MRSLIFLCGDVFAESQHRLQSPARWAAPRASLAAEPPCTAPAAPVLALLCSWWLQNPAPLWEAARRGRVALAGPVMPGKSGKHSSIAFREEAQMGLWFRILKKVGETSFCTGTYMIITRTAGNGGDGSHSSENHQVVVVSLISLPWWLIISHMKKEVCCGS